MLWTHALKKDSRNGISIDTHYWFPMNFFIGVNCVSPSIYQIKFSNPVHNVKRHCLKALNLVMVPVLTVHIVQIMRDVPWRHKIADERIVAQWRHMWPLLLTWFNFNPSMDM